MNVVMLTGNLARDPEKSYTNSGMAVTRITVAVNRFSRKEGQPDADFIRVTVWDKQAENVEKYLRKGSKVGIEGRIQTGSYEKEGKTNYTTDVIANRVEFLDSRRDADGGGGGYGGGSGYSAPPAPKAMPQGGAPAPSVPDGFAEIDDDDMPF